MIILKRFLFLFLLASLFCGSFYFPQSSIAFAEQTYKSVKLNNQELTIGNAQDLTIKYMQKKYGSTNDLDEHLESFLESGQPNDITNLSEYQAMRTYASTYLMQQQLVEVNPLLNKINDNDNGELQNISPSTTVKEVQIENAKTIDAALNMLKISAAITSKASSSFVYDKYAARDYVYKYYENYNSAYARFSNDCTNFASQVVHAGGYAKHDDWYMNKLASGDFAYSRSWSLVYDFSIIGLLLVIIRIRSLKAMTG